LTSPPRIWLARSNAHRNLSRQGQSIAYERSDRPRGARLEVHIEKGRGLHGEDAKRFEARLDIGEGKTACRRNDVEDAARLQGRERIVGPDDTMQIGGTCSWSR
jgi:hypothetical protein